MADENVTKTTETGAPAAHRAEDPNLHEIAGGWIMERKGTNVPGFLKATYIVVACSCIGYSLIWINGDAGDSDRGRLVQQFDAATGFSPGVMWFATFLVVIFALILFKFAFTEHKD